MSDAEIRRAWIALTLGRQPARAARVYVLRPMRRCGGASRALTPTNYRRIAAPEKISCPE